MMKIKVTFLGTGQAVPTASRNHSSVLVSYDNENLLFDCGEGTQRQLRKVGSHPNKITRLFITHWHGDHILGIPGFLQSLSLSDRKKPLYVYGPKGTKKFMSEILGFFVYVPKDKFAIEVHEVIIENDSVTKVFDNPKFFVEAAPMDHSAPCIAYSLVEKDKFRIKKDVIKKLKLPNSPIIGELQKGKNVKYDGKLIKAKEATYLQKGRKLSLVTDTKINDNAIKLAKNSDVLICESTYGSKEADLANDYKHMTSEQSASIAKKSKSKKLYLTHISQRYDNHESILLKEAKKVFKNVNVAEDLLSFSF